MAQVTVSNIIRRANTKLRKDNARICTSRGWRERANCGRWHMVNDRNIVTDWWNHIGELQDWARDNGIMHPLEKLCEN